MFDLKIARRTICLWQVSLHCYDLPGVMVSAPWRPRHLKRSPVEAVTADEIFQPVCSQFRFSSDGEMAGLRCQGKIAVISGIDLAFEQTGVPSYGSAANIYVLNRRKW